MSLTERIAAVTAPIDTSIEALTQRLHALRAEIDAILDTLARQNAAADAQAAPAAAPAPAVAEESEHAEMPTPEEIPAAISESDVTCESEIEGESDAGGDAAPADVEIAADETPIEPAALPAVVAVEVAAPIEAEMAVAMGVETAAEVGEIADAGEAADIAETQPAIEPELTLAETVEMPAQPVALEAAVEMEMEAGAETAAELPEIADASAELPEAPAAEQTDLVGIVAEAHAETEPTEPAMPATVVSLADHVEAKAALQAAAAQPAPRRHRAGKIAACILAALAMGSLWFADFSALGGVPSSVPALSTNRPAPLTRGWAFGQLWQGGNGTQAIGEADGRDSLLATEGFVPSSRYRAAWPSGS